SRVGITAAEEQCETIRVLCPEIKLSVEFLLLPAVEQGKMDFFPIARVGKGYCQDEAGTCRLQLVGCESSGKRVRLEGPCAAINLRWSPNRNVLRFRQD